MIKTYQHDHITLTAKGQKIIAAIFLVTGHLPETDAMRQKLRLLAVGLADCTENTLTGHCATITALIESAQLAGMVSEANAKIISAELKYFSDPLYRNDTLISGLFPNTQSTLSLDKGHVSDKKTHHTDMSFNIKTSSTNVLSQKDSYSEVQREKKDKRQEKILSYIAVRKSASIKDIATLFPDVSEKTIQRELNVLVTTSKINKRGNKRWSIYLAI